MSTNEAPEWNNHQPWFTQSRSGINLDDNPAISGFGVGYGPEEGENGGLLSRLRQKAVYDHRLVGKLHFVPAKNVDEVVYGANHVSIHPVISS